MSDLSKVVAVLKESGKPAEVERIEAIAKSLQANLTVEKDGSAVFSKDAYAQTLEVAGLEKDVVRKVTDHNHDVIAAAALIFGATATPVMAANKDITRMTAKLDTVGRDAINLTFDRKAEYGIPKSDDKVTRFGEVNAVFKSYGSKNSGNFAHVKRSLSSYAEKLLK